jgi:UDP-N-acetylmuramate--L-alanine ligase
VNPRHLHVVGIGGFAVSGVALLAQQRGDRVTGSDEGAGPPTSDILTRAGIPWVNHHGPENLDRWGTPDLVLVGNHIRPQNPEWQEVRRRGLPLTSEIELFVSLTEGRQRLVVCGTHGKTTTASLTAHMLARAGMDPGYRLGSLSRDLGGSVRLGTGPVVIEGDEYTTAPWDRRPKFLHTHPTAAAVTRLEWDHPDVYASPEAYREAFVRLAETVPAGGLLLLCGDDPAVLALRGHARAPVEVYGEGPEAGWRVTRLGDDGAVQRLRVDCRELRIPEIALTLPGRHNALNAACALALAHVAGAPLDVCAAACADFRGPLRRFQVVGEAGGVIVVDDHVDHPTEARATLAAARLRYPGRRVIAVHTPHTYSRVRMVMDLYPSAFADADVVVLGPIDPSRERGQPATVSSADVAARLRDREVHQVASSAEAVQLVTGLARSGDVVVMLSVGGFDGFAARLFEALSRRAAAGTVAGGGHDL